MLLERIFGAGSSLYTCPIYLKKISGFPLIYGYMHDSVGFFVVDEAITVSALNPEADVEAERKSCGHRSDPR